MNSENLGRKLIGSRLHQVLTLMASSSVCGAQTNSETEALPNKPGQVKIARFLSLPPVPGQQDGPTSREIDPMAVSSQSRFIPIPAFEDLLPAPQSLIQLAQSVESDPKKLQDQKTITGSDAAMELRDSDNMEILSKPVYPYEIAKKVKAQQPMPQNEQSLPSQPDPRYFKYWPECNAQWISPAFCYKPLYFEQSNLERYGLGFPCPTNALVSGSRFFIDAAFLPIHALRQPPHSCQCTLGHRRPGDCNPIQR